MSNSGQGIDAEVWAIFWNISLVKLMRLRLRNFILKFGRESEADFESILV